MPATITTKSAHIARLLKTLCKCKGIFHLDARNMEWIRGCVTVFIFVAVFRSMPNTVFHSMDASITTIYLDFPVAFSRNRRWLLLRSLREKLWDKLKQAETCLNYVHRGPINSLKWPWIFFSGLCTIIQSFLNIWFKLVKDFKEMHLMKTTPNCISNNLSNS